MPKLRHLGIRTEDTGKLAQFYVDVFDMQVIHKSKEEGGTVFLSDGYFNLAIIPNKDQNATNGLYHFGFQVEDLEGTLKIAAFTGAKSDSYKKPRDGRFAEMGVQDPVGTPVDVSVHGWKA